MSSLLKTVGPDFFASYEAGNVEEELEPGNSAGEICSDADDADDRDPRGAPEETFGQP